MEGIKNKIHLFLLLFSAVVFLFSFQVIPVDASFSQFINYQGKLLDSSGAAVADGDYVMEFKFYSSGSGGSELWSESRSGADSIAVTSGLFSVMLGEVTPFPATDDFFNQSLYLEVSVGSTSPETLTPRKLLGAVPAALFSSNSSKLSGLSSSSFLRSDTTNTASVFDSATSTSLFASIFNAVDSVISNLTATLANIVSLVFDTAVGNYLAVTNLNVTSTANIKDLNASSSVVINSTSTNFYSSNAVITGGAIASSTISGLNIGNFVTPNVSQWTNDAGYLTSYVETDPIFMAASTSLAYQPIGSYLTVESDPIWLAASTSYLTTSSAASIYQPIGSYLVAESDPIWLAASSSYLTVADASATYGSFTYNSSTFLTVASATATYLTQATAASTYLTQANAVSTYLAINAASTTLWDTAYLWGDHSSVGYLTTSSNLTVANFASPNVSQWTNDAGYLTSYVETDPIFMAASTSLPYQPIGSYLTVESDPIWLAASTSYANLSLVNTFTNINSFVTTTFSGNVGIGTTSPEAKLVVDDGSINSFNSFDYDYYDEDDLTTTTYSYQNTFKSNQFIIGGSEGGFGKVNASVYGYSSSTDSGGNTDVLSVGLAGEGQAGVMGVGSFYGGLFAGQQSGIYGVGYGVDGYGGYFSGNTYGLLANGSHTGAKIAGEHQGLKVNSDYGDGLIIDVNETTSNSSFCTSADYTTQEDCEGAGYTWRETGLPTYSIYSENGINYFGGKVGIGTTTPTKALTVNGEVLSYNSFSSSTYDYNSTVLLGSLFNGQVVFGPESDPPDLHIGVYSNVTSTDYDYEGEISGIGLYSKANFAGIIGEGTFIGGLFRGGDYGIDVTSLMDDGKAGSFHIEGIDSTGIAINAGSWATNATGISIDLDDGSYGLKINNRSSTGYAIYSQTGLNYFEGNVGIGTINPQTKLSVVGTSTFQGDISVSGGLLDSTGNYGTNGQILLSTGTSTLWVSTSTLGFVGGSSQWLDSGSDIYFSTGNVGIGTTTPSEKLVVDNGSINSFNSFDYDYYDEDDLTTTTYNYQNTFKSNYLTNSLFGLTNTGVYGYATSTDYGMNADLISSGLMGEGQVGVFGLGSLFGGIFTGSQMGIYGLSSGDGGYGGYFSGDNGLLVSGTGHYGAVVRADNQALFVDGDYDGSDGIMIDVGDSIGGSFCNNPSYNNQTDCENAGYTWRESGSVPYAIFAENGLNYFGGKVGIGTSTPTQQLEITQNFGLPVTTGTTPYGIIYKGTEPFISDFSYGLNGNGITPYGQNTFVGVGAGNLTMGSTATYAGLASYNTAIGYGALHSNTTGFSNSAQGVRALYSNTSGQNNSAQGNSALEANTGGYDNTAQGAFSLYANTSGHHNTAQGFNSGRFIADGSTGRIGGNNGLYLGADSKASANGTDNEIVIGYNAIGAGSNSVVLGNTNIVKTLLNGKVGIGTINPQTKLSVVGTSTFQGDISVSGGLLDSIGSFGTNGQILLSTGTSTLWVSTSTLGFVGGSSQWLDSGSDIYFSTGNVGIGTSTPLSALTIQADNNWLSLNRSDGYFLNVSWEESTIDYPLISGLASSTAILGGDLSAVGLKDRAVIVGDSEPNLSFSNYTGILSSLATIAFNTDTEIINFTGAKDYDWFDYDTGESQFVRFDAENLQVMVGTTTPYTATTSLTVSGSLYADHIYTSGNSFYMNGTKVIGSDETNLNFYADSGQNLKLTSVNGALQLLNTGSGGINLNSSSSLAVYGSTVDITGTNSLVVQTTGNSHGLTIQTNGNASNIGINANGTNSSVDLYATADISLTAPALTLTGALGLTGGLTVSGATTINNNLTATGTVTFSGLTSGLLWSTNGVISSVATNTLGIISSQWIANGSDIYYGVGNVGIGSSSPSSKLSVGGNAYIGGNLTATGTLAITGTATSTFAGTIAVSGNGTSTFAGGINITSGCFAINGVCIEAGGTGTSQWTTVGSDIYYATGKIAVGTSTVSTSTLTVYGGADFIPNFDTLLSSTDIHSGSSGYYAHGVEVVGNYAYVVGTNLEGTASGQEFIIFDISDRTNPVAVGGINFDAAVESIYIRGKYAYLGGNGILGTSDFVVYDISSSTNPIYVGGITLATGVDSIDLVGNYAYVTDYTTSGFSGSDVKILDISDPTNIRYLGGRDGLCNGFTKVSAYGDKYMIVSGYTGCDGVGGADQSLIIFDVSDPINPTPVSGYSSAGESNMEDLDFYIYKHKIYILSRASSTAEIQILDIKNPLSPVYLGSYDINTSIYFLSSGPSTIFVSNGYAFVSVANSQDDDLLILDVSDPANIIKIDGVEAGVSRSDLTVSNGYLYVVGKPGVYLNIYDIGGIKSVTADIGSLYSQFLSVDDFSSLGVSNFLNSVYMSDIRSAEGVVNFNTNRVALNPFNTTAGSTGVLSFNELSANGSNYVGFKAPDLLATNTVWTLPVSDGNINSFLTTDGVGNLSWGELAIGATAFLSEVNFISTPDTTQAWANMPLAETEFDGAVYTRKQVNMTNYTQFRLVSNQSVQGHTTAYLQAEYSTDGGSNWSNLEDTITGADLLSDTTGLHYGAWGYIADGAKSDVMIRIVGHSGNGVADPAWRQLSIQFKGYAGSQWASETGGNISYASGSVSIGTTTAGDYNLRIASSSNWLEMTNGGDVYTRFSILASNIGNIPLLSSQADTSDVLGVDASGIFVKNSMYMLGVDSSPILNFATMDGNDLDASMYMGFDGTNFAFSGGAASYAWLDSNDENVVASITNTGNIYSSALNSNGAVYSNNGILTNVNPSSMSYKSNITSSTLDIDALLGLQVKSFVWNSNGQADFGLIAEEIRDALPELYVDDGTTKGYRADHLPFYLLQVAQKQRTDIADLDLKLIEFSSSSTLNFLELQNKDLEIMELIDSLRYPVSTSTEDVLPEEVEASIASGSAVNALDLIKLNNLGMIEIETDLKVLGKLIFGEDSVGRATIEAGNVSTTIKFKTPYPEQYPPIVTISPLDFIDGSYRVSNISSSSFDIELQRSQSADVGFGWHAFGAGYEIASHLHEDPTDESGASDFIMGDITEIDGLEVDSVSTSEMPEGSSTDQESSDADSEEGSSSDGQEGLENEADTENEVEASAESSNQEAPPAVEETPDYSQPEDVSTETTGSPPAESESSASATEE